MSKSGGDRNRTYSDIVTRFTVWPGSPTPAHPRLSIKRLKRTLNQEDLMVSYTT